jgi:nitroimidazol reductase NimA-like FMN-containing flavoprotein (pyridoxamine 5'-phosphate oxidase superfamily)
MFGKLNEEQTRELFSKQVVGRLACHADGKTYVVPVSYAFDGQSIYVHSGKGLKLDLMRKNPRVCFQVDNTRDLSNWQSAVAWGQFEELEAENDKQVAIKTLRERVLPPRSSETMHLSPDWPFSASTKDRIGGIFFRIRVDEMTGRYEKNSTDFLGT